MIQFRPIVCTLAIVTVAVIAAAFLLGAGLGSNQNPSVNVERNLLPRVQVIEFDDTVARFDTQTGSIMRFSGNLDLSSAAGTWMQSVRAVTGTTSGYLQMQVVGDSTFLVDVVDGDTWVLRRLGTVGSWQKVKVNS